jgi:hypothetical protein
LAAENEREAEWDLTSRQPSQLSEIINSEEIKGQVRQDEVTGRQKQFREGEEFGSSDTDNDACSELENLPSHANDLLKLIWKTMQEEKIERERIRQETEERQEMNRKEDRERLEQLIKKFREDVEKMRESLVEKCKERASKLAVDISNLENKIEHNIVELNNKIQKVEKVQSQ